MTHSKILQVVILLASSLLRLQAQNTITDSLLTDKTHKFEYTKLIIPTALIGVGVIGLESDWLKFQNHEIRDELQENIDKKITLDDFTQYAPMMTVYGLNLCGIKSKHNFRGQTIILVTAYLLMGVSVNSLKLSTHVERPDGSSFNSFPSGHTATAFMGAEFLWQEYREVSPWIGVAGYAVAAGIGAFRMYNNRHWLTDVLAGAGIGILSTKVAYCLYPCIQKRLFRKSHIKNTVAVPYYDGKNIGLSFQTSF
jgi:Membrane-associated phospholipid phosphatase